MDAQADIETYIADHGPALPAKFTIKVADLKHAVGIVKDAAEGRGNIPILSNVLLNVASGQIKFTTTNMEIAISHVADGAVSHPGDFTVPVALLAEVASRLPNDGIAELLDGETTVALKCDRFKFSLPRFPSIEFPATASRIFPVSFNINAKLLADMMDRVSFMSDTSETRHYLSGIFFHVVGDQFRVVACQRAGGAVSVCELPDGSAEMSGFNLPKRSCVAVRRILGDIVGEILVEESRALVRMTAGATTLTTKLIDAEFPEYDRIFPGITKTPLAVDRDALKESIAAAAGVSNEFDDAPVIFNVTPERMTIRAKGKEYAAALVEMGPEHVAYKGAEMEKAFSAKILAPLIASMKGAVVWHFTDVESAGPGVLVLDDGDPFVRYVVGSYKV